MMISGPNNNPFTPATRRALESASSQQAAQANAGESKEPSDQVQIRGNQEASAGSEVASSTAEPAMTRRQIPGSYIAIAPADAAEQVAMLDDSSGISVDRKLGEVNGSAFFLVHKSDNDFGLESVEDNGPFTTLLPNFEYEGDIFDGAVATDESADAETPVPDGRPRHLDIINIEPAWDVTKGNPTVISAITDTGLDVAHPVLAGTIWQNPNEVADGKDNDGNGYVDDLIGWDITDNDNDPSDTASTHHTHVHGIVHANEGDSGATGVAPEAKGMVLRIAGGRRRYSSAVVAESYLYAMNQGAKSVNTSFNIDHFAGDKAIEETYRTLLDNDVLIFNSAGNGSTRNSGRTKFEDIILVASTETNPSKVDQKSGFSNWGHGIDLSAPGSDIMSTLPNGRVGSSSGTSMAAPVAMGVDLLVQSANPDWNAAQRYAQIAGTADNIDAQNPNLVGEMGFGRVNAGRALNETVAAPTLSAREVKDASGSTRQVTVRFEKVFDPASANKADAWKIINGEGETVMQGAPREVRLMTNEINFDVNGLPAGEYKLVGSAEHLVDPWGQPLDGDGDGQGGDDFVYEFRRS